MEEVFLLQTNLDDVTGELTGYLMEECFKAGALDAYTVPIQMKKSRPAVTMKVLVPPSREEEIKEVVFSETKTLGMRISEVDKEYLDREIVHVETPFGSLRVKLARQEGKQVNIAPEYEDCRKIAAASGVPLKEVYAAAEEAARALLSAREEGEENPE